MNIDEIDMQYKYREILKSLPNLEGEPEMSEFDSAFLCGCLSKFKPSKILEVGIAGGGTTAIIEYCLTKIVEKFSLISIDINEKFYRDNRIKSGYLGIELDKRLKTTNEYTHKYLYNHAACYHADIIGDNIDCLIIDTVHSMPGEILDFITLLPYLKDGCVVILHDILYNHITRDRNKSGISNIVLFSAVTAEKYINMDKSFRGGIPNVAAFVINKDTRRNIEDIFLSLLVTWNYIPEKQLLEEYRSQIRKYYDNSLNRLFDSAVEMNQVTLVMKKKMWQFPFYWLQKDSRVVLYGAGNVGEEFVNQIKAIGGVKLSKWIDKNYKKINSPNIEGPRALAKMDKNSYDYVVIAVEDKGLSEEIHSELLDIGIPKEKILWKNPLLL